MAGAGSEAFDRLRELHILSNFTLPAAPDLPVIAWFALINLVSLVASIAAVEVARRRIDTESHLGAARLLLVLHVVLIGMVLAFGLAVSFEMAALSYLVTRIVRRVAMPIAAAWINLGLTSDVRATVHSMNSQADALGQIAGGPFWAGSLWPRAAPARRCSPWRSSSPRHSISTCARSGSMAATCWWTSRSARTGRGRPVLGSERRSPRQLVTAWHSMVAATVRHRTTFPRW